MLPAEAKTDDGSEQETGRVIVYALGIFSSSISYVYKISKFASFPHLKSELLTCAVPAEDDASIGSWVSP